MQSSPPTRAWERPSSPARSQYSLDLGALDLDSDSDRSTPRQHVDRVFSEDIDGPSDFTLNMGNVDERWYAGERHPSRGPGAFCRHYETKAWKALVEILTELTSPATSVLKLERPTASNHHTNG